MYRCFSAYLVLVFIALGLAPANAKSALITPAAIKKLPASAAPFSGREVAPTYAVPQQTGDVVRTQSIIVPPKSHFSAPEGALYTTSDECA